LTRIDTSGLRFQYFALRFGFVSVVWKTAFSVSVLFFVLFCFQLSASVTQRTVNGFLCFNALQRWLSACVTLLIRSLNYTFNRDTRHSHDDEINCNCVWQCFINTCQTNQKNTFFRASVLLKCYDFNSRVWAFPFVKFSDDARTHRIDIISHKLTFNTDINI